MISRTEERAPSQDMRTARAFSVVCDVGDAESAKAWPRKLDCREVGGAGVARVRVLVWMREGWGEEEEQEQ